MIKNKNMRKINLRNMYFGLYSKKYIDANPAIFSNFKLKMVQLLTVYTLQQVVASQEKCYKMILSIDSSGLRK